MAKGDKEKADAQRTRVNQSLEDYRTNTSNPRYDPFNQGNLDSFNAAKGSGGIERGYLTDYYQGMLGGSKGVLSGSGGSGSSGGSGEGPEGEGGGGGGGTPGVNQPPADPWATS